MGEENSSTFLVMNREILLLQ